MAVSPGLKRAHGCHQEAEVDQRVQRRRPMNDQDGSPESDAKRASESRVQDGGLALACWATDRICGQPQMLRAERFEPTRQPARLAETPREASHGGSQPQAGLKRGPQTRVTGNFAIAGSQHQPQADAVKLIVRRLPARAPEGQQGSIAICWSRRTGINVEGKIGSRGTDRFTRLVGEPGAQTKPHGAAYESKKQRAQAR